MEEETLMYAQIQRLGEYKREKGENVLTGNKLDIKQQIKKNICEKRVFESQILRCVGSVEATWAYWGDEVAV